MLRSLIALLVLSVVVGVCTRVAAADELPVSTPSSSVTSQRDDSFPSAAEVGDALGVGVEAMGISAGLGQLWEHVALEPGAVTVAQMQIYRVLSGTRADAVAGSVIEIVRFRSTVDAVSGGTAVATAITDSLDGFELDIPAELVAGGSWAAEDGPGGSVIVTQDGPVVTIVTIAGSDSADMEADGQTLTRLVLDKVRGSAPSMGPGQPSAAESSPVTDW